jgi:protein-S-isoprenylcysteine O-methyltransferase Ste14
MLSGRVEAALVGAVMVAIWLYSIPPSARCRPRLFSQPTTVLVFGGLASLGYALSTGMSFAARPNEPSVVFWKLDIVILGALLRAWAIRSNRGFFQGWRHDRLEPLEEGPYRFLRHPGYVGSIAMVIGAASIVGTAVAILGASAAVIGYCGLAWYERCYLLARGRGCPLPKSRPRLESEKLG